MAARGRKLPDPLAPQTCGQTKTTVSHNTSKPLDFVFTILNLPVSIDQNRQNDDSETGRAATTGLA